MEKNMPMMARIVVAPTVLAMVIVGQLMGKGPLILSRVFISYIVGFVLAAAALAAIPLHKIAGFLIEKIKLIPESAMFTIAMNAIINLVFSLIVGFGSTYLNVRVFGQQSMVVVMDAMIKSFIPMFIISYIVSSTCLKMYKKTLEKNSERQ